jgi:hypothetical protein
MASRIVVYLLLLFGAAFTHCTLQIVLCGLVKSCKALLRYVGPPRLYHAGCSSPRLPETAGPVASQEGERSVSLMDEQQQQRINEAGE